MTEFEIRQLIFDIEAVIADQFQFWMAATFAVVVVSYTAGARPKVWTRICVAALHFAAVTTFFLRYWRRPWRCLAIRQLTCRPPD